MINTKQFFFKYANKLSCHNSIKIDIYNVYAIMDFEFLRDIQVTTEMKFKTSANAQMNDLNKCT